MADRAIARVVEALRAGGGKVRFVGGCVRDALLGRAVSDIDLATPEPPERVMERLRAASITVIPTGIEHGTVTAIVAGRPIEITTLRKDVETFGRHARVAFTDDWSEDAARRDFTINTLSADPDGTLHDPFGGLEDLRAGRVRFVGDARTRIGEDVLRLLRFFRFHAYYARTAPDAAALEACRALAPGLANLSGERIATELRRILVAPDAPGVVALMAEIGVIAHLLPQLRHVDRLASLARIEIGPIAPDWVRRLAALIDGEDDARALAERLRLSNRDRDRLILLAARSDRPNDWRDARARRRDLHRLGADNVVDLSLLAWARDGEADRHRASIEATRADAPPRFPLAGRDALELGIAPGPAVGRALAAVEQWWIDGDFRADRAACLDRLRAELRPPGSG